MLLRTGRKNGKLKTEERARFFARANKLKRSVITLVQIIMGLKGSGKTKRLVELVREAVNEDTGDVVCIEKERKLTFDIPYQARLIEAGSYDVGNYEFLKGLICGVHAGNYDITHFFIDNFYKLVNDKSVEALESFLAWLDKFSAAENKGRCDPSEIAVALFAAQRLPPRRKHDMLSPKILNCEVRHDGKAL